MTAAVLDDIYEAAFVPERWPGALARAGADVAAAAAGAIVVWSANGAPLGFRATALTEATLGAFVSGRDWQRNERAPALHADLDARFTCVEAMLTADAIARDPVQASLRRLGLESQAATIVALPGGEQICFTFERLARDGRFDAPALARLDALRPHLARAGLMASRLGLERARSMLSALQTIGLPAAVLTGAGRVLTTNEPFDAMSTTFRPAAGGGLGLVDEAGDALLQQTLAAARDHVEPAVRSLPVAAGEGRDAMVVHLLPLRRAAHEIFAGGDLLLVATAVRADASLPAPAVLRGLFDLTPAEVRLATALAAGQSLQQAAVASAITPRSARTYLDRIFRKTGTHQQSQLVALLKSAHAFPSTHR